MARYRYEFPVTVPDYDCDPHWRLRPAAALRYLQTAAGGHLSSLGLGYQRLYAEGFVFVATGNAVLFRRMPTAGETILVSTAPVKTHGAHFFRETVCTDAAGHILLEGQSAWALCHPETGQLYRATAFPYPLPTLDGEWHPFLDPSKIRIDSPAISLGERIVRLSDLDLNCHMNNTVYADVLLDAFAEPVLASGGVGQLLLRYRNPARLGEQLSLTGGNVGTEYRLSATVGGKSCFEGSFSLKQEISACNSEELVLE